MTTDNNETKVSVPTRKLVGNKVLNTSSKRLGSDEENKYVYSGSNKQIKICPSNKHRFVTKTVYGYPGTITNCAICGISINMVVSNISNEERIRKEECLRIKKEWELLMKTLYTELGQHQDADKLETLYHLHNYKMIREFEKVFEGKDKP